MRNLPRCFFCLIFLWLLLLEPVWAQSKISWKNVSVLVYTKNGKGYVHDNIPSAVAAIQKLAQQHGFKVDVSDKPEVFTNENLKKYSFLLFPSTNNDVFDTNEQRLAFRKYMQAGGGFVGLHSVIGTERNWPWFKMMLGGSFVWHPPFQKLRILLIDPTQPSAQGLPKIWEKEDECYLMKDLYPGTHTFLAHDLSQLNPNESEKIKSITGPFTSLYPAAWYQKFDGGSVWITSLGHAKTDYQDAMYLRHIWQGMQYVAGQVHKLDYAKAYATTHDEAVRY